MKIYEFHDFSFTEKMKKRRKPLILLGFPAEFLAFPRGFEPPTYRLGDTNENTNGFPYNT